MIDFQTIIISVISILGGGGAAWLFIIRSTRRSAAANAKKDEATAETTEVEKLGKIQEVYQDTIADLREDKKILKEENQALKDENQCLRENLAELREVVERNSKDIHELKMIHLKEKCVNNECKERVIG